MHRYAALLRAINVGGHTVKMDVLRAQFEELKLRRVESLIASGNILFDSASTDSGALEARIEKHLQRALGYAVATFLRTTDELTAIVEHEPFGRGNVAESDALHVIFTRTTPTEQSVERVLTLRTPMDDFQVRGREVYWRCRGRTSDSTVSGAVLERALALPATARNITTVRKLAAKMAAPPAN